MASRADLIMAQVRGELSQIYRKKKDEGSVIDDVTAGILGFQTGQEAMYAIEGAVKDFKEFRKTPESMDRQEKRIQRRLDKMDRREQRKLDAIDMSISDFEEEDTIYEPTPGAFQTVGSQRALDRMEFDTFSDAGTDKLYQSDFSNMDAPLPKPDRPMVKSVFTEELEMEPDMMLDEEKLPISEKDIMNRTSELYLNNTLDTVMSPSGGMMNTSMSESTGYNYSNVNIEDIPGTNYDLDAIKATAQAAGVTRWYTGGNMSDVEPKEDEIVNEAINKVTAG